MEVPLTPLEFARRTRRLHGHRQAVVDGDLRLTYEQFFDRCDRWAAALVGMGVKPGDRVVTIAPNTHAQLEAFYAVPQVGAVLVAINSIGTLLHLPMGVGEPYLWTLPMFHANGWTYTWTVTAAAGVHICLRKVEPVTVFRLIREEKVSWLCAAPTVLISLANASPQARGEVPAGVHVVTAGAAPAAATIERLEGDFGWEVTQVYGLTETAPFITVCAPLPEHRALNPADRAVVKARQGVELLTSGELRVVDKAGDEVAADGQSLG